MPHNIFGWSYPPGCSGPPEPPGMHPDVEEICDVLTAANFDQQTIDKVCELAEALAVQAEAECPVCLANMAKAEQEAMEGWPEDEPPNPDYVASD